MLCVEVAILGRTNVAGAERSRFVGGKCAAAGSCSNPCTPRLVGPIRALGAGLAPAVLRQTRRGRTEYPFSRLLSRLEDPLLFRRSIAITFPNPQLQPLPEKGLEP